MQQWQRDEIAKAQARDADRLLDELDERLPREPGEGSWTILVLAGGVCVMCVTGAAIVLNALTGV
jgi:hypothetical protein